MMPPAYARIRVCFKEKLAQSLAKKSLHPILIEMKKISAQGRNIISNYQSNGSNCPTKNELENEMEDILNDTDDPQIHELNKAGIGIDIPERVFFEAYITRQDLTRSNDYKTGRPSIAEFLEMNCATTRKWSGSGPRPVVL